MTPKYVGKDKMIVPLIHQLAREFWFYETPFPLSYLGYYYLENKWLSHYTHLDTYIFPIKGLRGHAFAYPSHII
jgi:hypothetical protein